MLDTRTSVLYNDITVHWRKTMEARLLKIKDVADMLGVSLSFAYVLTRRGDLPTVRIGNAIRVRVEDLERYVKDKAVQNEHPSSLPHR
jgi:excisionase family DNA binding protein